MFTVRRGKVVISSGEDNEKKTIFKSIFKKNGDSKIPVSEVYVKKPQSCKRCSQIFRSHSSIYPSEIAVDIESMRDNNAKS